MRKMNKRAQRTEMLRRMFELHGSEYSRCFAPTVECLEPAIRAHSIQNARSLEVLADDGHVIVPRLRFEAGARPNITFERIGRNKASTFSGLCSDHDREIFAPIDTGTVDWESEEHCFLVAYRAVFFELHASCSAAAKIQAAYLGRIAVGWDPEDEPSEAGLFAVHRMAVAYDMYQYKAQWDAAYLSKDYSAITHDVLDVEVGSPRLAASTLFSIDHLYVNGSVARVGLSVVPVSQSLAIALFSYLTTEATQARAELHDVFATSGALQRYALSKRLLNHCQNFVLSPSLMAQWSDEKKATILEYFKRTAFEDELDYDDPNLYLF